MVSTKTKMKCKIVTFAEIHDMVKSVAEQVKRSSFEPTTIVGLARGGTIPARLMCDFLGITDLISLKVEHWIETGKTKDEATIKYPLKADLSEKVILVLDDITDTGKSLVVSTDYLAKMKPLAMKVATLQYMPESTFKPDYFAEEVKVWTWFIYPWNWIEDTSTLIIRLMSTAKDRKWKQSEVKKDLLDNFEIEWDSKMLEYILHVMNERGQVDVIGDPSGITYKIKEEKVIKL